MGATSPVSDLALFLAGSWRIARRIADQRSGTSGRLTGTAIFTPAPGGLRYNEWGLPTCGAFRGEASQIYWFAVNGPRAAEVRFEDGRFFHCLDLSSGLADVVHECAPDRYRGRYRVSGRNGWTLAWQVQGPRKRMFIGTRYARAGPVLS